MKNTAIILLIITSFVACNSDKKSIDDIIENGTLEEMREKHIEVAESLDSVSNVLMRLEEAIDEKDTTQKYPLVTIFEVKDTVFNNFVSIQGNVNTRQNILIYPEYQGVLTQVLVTEGQRVQKGQLLAKIDDGGLASQLAQAESQLALAKTTYERQQRLWDQQIGSEMQLLESKTNLEATENSVKQLRSQLDKTTINAPFSGIIDNIITEQGQVVGPGGQALMRIVNLNNMYVEASVPENYMESISKGGMAHVAFPSLNLTVEGKISNIGNYINPRNRTFQIEISIPNKEKKIKPNLTATVQLNNYSNESAVVIPTNCIQENALGETYVYVITNKEENNAIVKKTKIETGHNNNGFVEVTDGLESDDIIVKDGALSLKDGATITIQSNNE